ncbi:hypothetical protein WN51_02119 [Melipona quadrifasciata]|uniref:Uncharacterized protein n=1 Tax=Melipona quadrifasciata TaxID=166423 RepID=A0A0M8ZTB3_9HYME|nr:hypothetical protein WN51_02119 [Melipona quadrifasciata]
MPSETPTVRICHPQIVRFHHSRITKYDQLHCELTQGAKRVPNHLETPTSRALKSIPTRIQILSISIGEFFNFKLSDCEDEDLFQRLRTREESTAGFS